MDTKVGDPWDGEARQYTSRIAAGGAMTRQGDEGDDGSDDLELFRRAMRDVRPLKGSERAAGARRPPAARARFARAERAAVLRESLESANAAASSSAGVDLYEVQPGE